ncbi:Venom allergen 5-like protein, partial [Leptotrombidium deliense]
EGLNVKDIKKILRDHNLYRNKVALGEEFANNLLPSSNMLKIEWDKELATVAQAHASQCLFEHDCNKCREVDNFSVGQNLYQKKSRATKVTAAWDEAIAAFYDEIKYVTPDIIESYIPETSTDVYSHFTQLIWADTWKIGCGYAAYHINDTLFNIEELYTCNYGPSGNVLFEKVYKNGTAVSDCPPNSSQSRIYSGLCNAKQNGPQKPVVSDSSAVLLLCDFGTNCSLKLSAPNRAFFITVYSGKYMSVRLRRGQTFTISLDTRVHPVSEGFCIQINHRMLSGVNGTKFAVELNVPEINWKSNIVARGTNHWIVSKLNIKWNYETEVRIVLSVAKESEMKYFDIDYIAILDGYCS